MNHTKSELLEELDYLEGAAVLPHSERTDAIREVINQHFKNVHLWNDPECQTAEEFGFKTWKAGYDQGRLNAIEGFHKKRCEELGQDFPKHSAQATPQAEEGETTEDLIQWLDEKLSRLCNLQATHPHLAWYPDENDKHNWLKIKSLLSRPRRVTRAQIGRWLLILNQAIEPHDPNIYAEDLEPILIDLDITVDDTPREGNK